MSWRQLHRRLRNLPAGGHVLRQRMQRPTARSAQLRWLRERLRPRHDLRGWRVSPEHVPAVSGVRYLLWRDVRGPAERSEQLWFVRSCVLGRAAVHGRELQLVRVPVGEYVLRRDVREPAVRPQQLRHVRQRLHARNGLRRCDVHRARLCRWAVVSPRPSLLRARLHGHHQRYPQLRWMRQRLRRRHALRRFDVRANRLSRRPTLRPRTDVLRDGLCGHDE